MCKVSPNSVLLVDDDPSLRTLLLMHLENAGFDTEEAEDGIDGLAKLRNALPRVIISDLGMPRMSGLEFVSVVRRRFPCIAVIVLSGSIPKVVPDSPQPDVWIEKDSLDFAKLLQTLRDLARKTPEHGDLPEGMSSNRTQPGFDGTMPLTCPDCLRTFQVKLSTQDTSVERIAVCSHCTAQVPVRIEPAGTA